VKEPVLFVDDIFVPQSLFVATIRSPIVHGRLVTIETPKLPPSYTLITASDIPGVNQLDTFAVPVLAFDEVSYRGEPVALLAGPDRAKLEDYASQCTVIVDEQEAENSPVAPSVLATHRFVKEMSTQAAVVGEAERVVSGEYRTGIQEHWYAESHGAVALIVPDTGAKEKVEIYTATQWPLHVKRSVAQVLALPFVSITACQLGVTLEGKVWYPSLIACQAALCAFITKKPVKLMLTREEDFRYSPKRTAAEVTINTDLDAAGTALKTHVKASVDLGAQAVFAGEILDRTVLGSLGLYRFPAVDTEGFGYQTPTPPQGPCVGFGLSQGFFAVERHVSRIADIVRQDPAQWRKDHLIRPGGSLSIGAIIKEQPVEQLIDMTAALCDYYRKWASYELLRNSRRHEGWDIQNETLRGIGLAVAYQGSGLLYGATVQQVTVTLEPDGTLEISTCSADYAGAALWKQRASEILSISPDNIRIIVAPESGPLCCTAVLTRLLEQACAEIGERRFKEMAPLTVCRSVEPVPVAAWNQKIIDKNALDTLSFGVAIIEVTIAPVTFLPNIRSICLGIDAGAVIAEKQAQALLKTQSIHALGWASREQLHYSGGKIPDELLYRYALLSPGEVPPISVTFLKNDDVPAKDTGELPFSTIPAAYAQAVSQAMDYPFNTIPLTALDVWEAASKKPKFVSGDETL
jgi:CO/xanthine dehydrogenase Mo-binding subunit